MGKIYELYPKEQRKIDNQARRIRGYEKLKKDLTNANRKLNRENRYLQQRIDKAIELLLDNTTDYTDGDFESMRFQNDVVKILKGSDSNDSTRNV